MESSTDINNSPLEGEESAKRMSVAREPGDTVKSTTRQLIEDRELAYSQGKADAAPQSETRH